MTTTPEALSAGVERGRAHDTRRSSSTPLAPFPISQMISSEENPSKPFVVGSIAHWLGKKADESKSHEWTIYLRSSNPDEDISVYVKKVVFILHPTLQPPTRSALHNWTVPQRNAHGTSPH